MKKPNKIYTLTIVYNEEAEELEYLQEVISVEDIEPPAKSSVLIDFSDYWDEETLKLLKDTYYLAEA
tara:strand:- start:170 stop:370 length:201 start_codon:yes stop_codon:yes gene_type:complete